MSPDRVVTKFKVLYYTTLLHSEKESRSSRSKFGRFIRGPSDEPRSSSDVDGNCGSLSPSAPRNSGKAQASRAPRIRDPLHPRWSVPTWCYRYVLRLSETAIFLSTLVSWRAFLHALRTGGLRYTSRRTPKGQRRRCVEWSFQETEAAVHVRTKVRPCCMSGMVPNPDRSISRRA